MFSGILVALCVYKQILQLFRPTSKATHFDLTDDFYKLTVEEIKREVKAKYVCVYYDD